MAVTSDAAIDWSPVWSPDGRFIYFSSDRGGAMNLWRIAVDQVERTPAGRARAGDRRRSGVGRDCRGSRRTDRGWPSDRASRRSIPVAIPFDPATLRAGAPILLDTRNNIRVPSDVSPDGKQIAYYSIGEQQEDIFVGPPDGPMRRVTDDAAARPCAGVHAGRPIARVLFEPGRQLGELDRSASTAAVCAR